MTLSEMQSLKKNGGFIDLWTQNLHHMFVVPNRYTTDGRFKIAGKCETLQRAWHHNGKILYVVE